MNKAANVSKVGLLQCLSSMPNKTLCYEPGSSSLTVSAMLAMARQAEIMFMCLSLDEGIALI